MESFPLTTRERYEVARDELLKACDDADAGTIDVAAFKAKDAAFQKAAAQYKSYKVAHPNTSPSDPIYNELTGTDASTGGSRKGIGGSLLDAGFHYKMNGSVSIPGISMKANVFPAMTAWNLASSSDTPAMLGRDARFLWPSLPTENAGTNTAVSDFVQSARTLTGTVERAVDATSTKANLDVTVAATVEAIKQYAVTLNSIPNIVLESSPQTVAFLNGEGQFQINRALDDAVLAAIVAATPAFGATGTTTIDKVRNAIAAMRLLGANPNTLVINPTDAAALDLFRVGGSTTTDGPYAFDTAQAPSHPLWGLRIVERIGGGSDPMYLIDTEMLGVLYLGQVKFDADPFTEFKKNLTTLRVEVNALFHVRNVQGARRIAAS